MTDHKLVPVEPTENRKCRFCSGTGGMADDSGGMIQYIACDVCGGSGIAAPTPPQSSRDAEWHEGAPPKPWSEEWFIAITTYDDRVVLRALPEEFSYDFKTADETYIKRDKIKCWMQFPDSDYVATSPTAPTITEEMVEAGARALLSNRFTNLEGNFSAFAHDAWKYFAGEAIVCITAALQKVKP